MKGIYDYMLTQKNSNVNIQDVVLSDVNSSTGKIYDWRGLKLKSLDVSESYGRIGFDKDDQRFLRRADKVSQCCNFLEFKRYFENNERKLHKAYFCKDRLCPGCMVRRSRKIYGQVSQVMDIATQKYEFIFLTLTVKNCNGEDLQETLTMMFQAWTKMFRRKDVKNAVKGWFRALEVTHNIDVNSKSYDTYHPHFHIILAVNKSYFTGRSYLKQEQWVEIWKDCLGVDYLPTVDIRRFRTNSKKAMSKSLAEAAKYTVKDNDYLIRDENENVIEDITDSSIYTLSLALRSRRLIAFGGELKKIHKMLNLDDAENGDLIMTDNDHEDSSDLAYVLESFRFGIGLTTGELNYYLYDTTLPVEMRKML